MISTNAPWMASTPPTWAFYGMANALEPVLHELLHPAVRA